MAENSRNDMSLFASILVLVLGILFLLANLNVIYFHDVIRMWPLLLIGLGIRAIFNYKQENKNEQDK
jgi:hypothetical protein